MTARDPRYDPQEGDVLRVLATGKRRAPWTETREVTGLRRRDDGSTHYVIAKHKDSRTGIDRITFPNLTYWQRWAESAEVLKGATE